MLLSQVKGKDVAELVACGREKMACVPCGGSAIPVAAGSDSGGGAAAAVVVAAEPVKEDKKEVEESDEVINFIFFFIIYSTNSFISTSILWLNYR